MDSSLLGYLQGVVCWEIHVALDFVLHEDLFVVKCFGIEEGQVKRGVIVPSLGENRILCYYFI